MDRGTMNRDTGRYIAFDVETPNARNDRISAIGVTVIEDGAITEEFYTLVNPETSFDNFNIELTGITPEQAAEAPAFPAVWARIRRAMGSGILVAHNAVFDLGVLAKCFQAYGISWKASVPYLCTVQIGRKKLPDISHRLDAMCRYYGIDLRHHQADSDSHACAEILLKYMDSGWNLDAFRKLWFFPRAAEDPRSGLPDQKAAPVGVSVPPLTEETYFVRDPRPRGQLQNSQPAQNDSCELAFTEEKPDARTAPAPSPAPERTRPAEETQTGKSASAGDRMTETLRKVYGHGTFRKGQREVIEGLLGGRDALCVMPTGSGKSVCYQLPALLLSGTAMVISPLISLMKDQVAALRGRGIPAACLNSALSEAEYDETAYQAARGGYRVLYVAPERLQAPGFVEMCRHMEISLVAVDEAHCISQWGQDFRPSYLKIPEFIHQLDRRPPVGAFTATATPRVKEDIRKHLELKDPVCVTTGFDRPNLSFSVYEPQDRDAALLELVRDRFRQSGIVYCATRKAVESVTENLTAAGIPATRYHAGLDREERMRNQEDFLFDRKRVMVATNAFGMGIDKSNVSYVIHYNMPKSLEAYYQEAGRAGRDGADADCILLYSGQDVMTARWLIEHGEDNPDLTPEEQAHVRAQDEERLKWMTFYARSRRCLRGDILRYFGENAPDRCGNCSNCVPDCEHRDLTIEAQMILSCVARTGQRLAVGPLAALLRGEMPENCPADIDPKTLTTFGLMKGESPERILEDIRILLEQGYADRADDGSGAMVLNDQSRDVLFRGQRVTVQRLRRRTAAAQGDADLFEALKRLRFEISSEEYIAASALFTDVTLRDICRRLPRTRKQLAKVDGMGVFKANRYGDRILRLIERFAPEKQGRKASAEKSGPVKPASPAAERTQRGTFTEIKDRLVAEGNTEAYQPWTSGEEEQLRREFRENRTLKEMAEIHKRTRGAILKRLRKMGLA